MCKGAKGQVGGMEPGQVINPESESQRGGSYSRVLTSRFDSKTHFPVVTSPPCPPAGMPWRNRICCPRVAPTLASSLLGGGMTGVGGERGDKTGQCRCS